MARAPKRLCGSRLRHYPACTIWPASIHLHSRSLGRDRHGAQIARRPARGADVVLLTDHDSLGPDTGEEGWYGTCWCWSARNLAERRNHCSRSGSTGDRPRGLDAAGICEAVRTPAARLRAHPFSRGRDASSGRPHALRRPRLRGARGIELWSFVTDTGEPRERRRALRFMAMPGAS